MVYKRGDSERIATFTGAPISGALLLSNSINYPPEMQLKIELILVTLATAYPAAAAIENVKGCKGWGEGDYYKITGLSFDECEDHCHDAIDCLAFEYDREDKFCEIWTTFPEKIRRQDGKHCSTWNDDHSFTEHDGYSCRTSDGGKGEERTCEGWGEGDFEKFEGYACRTDDGKNGKEKSCKEWGEGDYCKITGLSFDECEDHCHDAIDCLAFEYDREDKFCEIWTTFPEKIRRQDGKHCSTWNDDHSFTEHDGYSCRTSDGGKGEERTCEGWGGGDFYKRSLKLDDCLDECINSSEQCKAVEYMYDTGAYHCVIWTSFPEEEEPKKNFDCYKREDAN